MRETRSFLYVEIAESLRRRIAAGELQPGDKLPPVREMARRWECTPGTVSRAYALLSDEGLVTGHRGGGTRVAASALLPERPAWQWAALVNQAEQFLLTSLAGGYAVAQIETALSVAISRWQELQGEPSPTAIATAAEGFRIAGSHDLAVELAVGMARRESDVSPTVEHVGSLGGLMALAQERAEAAGCHLWDEATDTYNVPFVRRLLPGRELVLLTVAHRSLGLIVAPNNPQQVNDLADLARPGVRLINRQSGSGTRVWLDAQLAALRIAPGSLAGYEQEALTHTAVAQTIADGTANVGLGIHAAAAAHGLGFVALTRERYDLVFLQATWNSPDARALTAAVRSAQFKEAVAALGGYDTAETGQETPVP